MGARFEPNEDVGSIFASDYQTGFYVFLGLSCALGLLIPLVLGLGLFGCRKEWFPKNTNSKNCTKEEKISGKTKLVQVTLLILLGLGVSLLACGSFIAGKSYSAEDNVTATKGIICVVFGFTAVVISYPCFVYGWRGDGRTNVIVAATYFLIIPGWIMLSMYFKNLSLMAEYEIVAMNVTNTRVYRDDAIECNFAGKQCVGYRGQMKLSWLPEEYCPDVSPGSSCTAWVTDPSCDRYVSNGNTFIMDDALAVTSATKCIQDEFDLLSFGDEMETQDMDDQNTTTSGTTSNLIEAFGSCTCDAILDSSENILEVFKTIGLGMSSAGICILLFVALQYHGQKRKVSTKKAGKEGRNDTVVEDTSSSCSSLEIEDTVPAIEALTISTKANDAGNIATPLSPREMIMQLFQLEDVEAFPSSPANDSSTAGVKEAIVAAAAAADAGAGQLEERLVWVGNYLQDAMAKYRPTSSKR